MYKTIITLLTLLVMSKSKVIYLDDSNYTTFTITHNYIFVKFYTADCANCIAMAEDYQKLAEKSNGKEYVIAQVDVKIAKNTQRQFEIKGFPALKFLVHGHIFDYFGQKTTQAMQKWIQSKMTSEIKQIKKNQRQNLAKQDVVVIEGGSKQHLRILSFAQKINQIPYYHYDSDKLSIKLYLQSSQKLNYAGDINIKRVSEWVALKLKGYLVALKNSQMIRQVFQNKQQLPAFLLVKNGDFTDENFKLLSTFCQAEQNKLKCGYADRRHEIYQGIYSFLKLNDTQHSFLILLDYEIRNGYQVPNPTSITADSLKSFVQEVRSGKISKYYEQLSIKKQPQFQYKHVLKLTTENFNTTIQNNRYVFVQYYSTYCKYCAQFAAEYEKLAHKLTEEKSQYVIAAVDIDQQQQIRQQVKVNGYPTFRFYVKTVEIEYQGNRNAQSIIAYMQSVKTSKLKTISNISDLVRPSIVIYGLKQDSTFHLLPLIYTRYPVYQFIGNSPFKVEIHQQKKHSAIYGQQEIQNIANWLEEQTEPTIINIVGSTNSKKLSTALEEHGPLLIFVNRISSSHFNKIYRQFENFCYDKVEYLCGIASKQQIQFQSFDEWVGEYNKSKNSLMYVTTQKFEKYIYEGDLAKLTSQRIQNFIKNIKDGKIKPITNRLQEDSNQQLQNNTDHQKKDDKLTNQSKQQIPNDQL